MFMVNVKKFLRIPEHVLLLNLRAGKVLMGGPGSADDLVTLCWCMNRMQPHHPIEIKVIYHKAGYKHDSDPADWLRC